ncbi:tRNA nucleotidyltransferase (CCA-adding enzyme) [Sporobacter termitidis DSM 10068]|uniref:tRNA nucleotidyltransferase (CCA-adding enzyme) n=1 Tax=Sporobacter termitidis DSM 10068 TaxID=1123282 RepID=A0A1M5UPM0_9FIRM|nr:CCA tRNA nucleotidyltransferase [Sporobacter termitidis]SHH64945.1 tRNA nucleotidyltransferase (CCA-adding enzyme) [Sporobacter termitidis DSM 10068]
MNVVPDDVADILRIIENAGHEAVLVGGCVRDMLLGRAIHDWDVATSAMGEAVSALFPKTVDTGARFGTVTVVTGRRNVEVTTFRSDGAYTDGRRPDSVLFVGALEEDLKRRDFTMNAMAMRLDGVIVDPFDGRGDIARRLIRCVGRPEDRFSEDALRMFRALRFSAQLSFDIEENTMAAVRKCAALCSALSAERVRDETEKILLSPRPAAAAEAAAWGLYAGRLRKADVPPDVLSRIAGLAQDRRQRWAAFCAVLRRAGAVDSAKEFLRDMRLDARTVKSCGAGAEAALAAALTDRLAVKKILADLGTEAGLCAAAADAVLRSSAAVSLARDVLDSGECYLIKDLAVTGDDLIAHGVAPGAQVGVALKKLLGHVLVNPADNKRDILLGMLDKT